MRFWDTSALVPLFADEEMTPRVRNVLALDSKVIVWSFTRVELASAMWRRDPPPRANRAAAIAEVMRVWSDWSEVTRFESVTAHAISMCERHRLRAGDALQLAAALVASRGKPSSLPFVTLDHALASAARAEGFPVLP